MNSSPSFNFYISMSGPSAKMRQMQICPSTDKFAHNLNARVISARMLNQVNPSSVKSSSLIRAITTSLPTLLFCLSQLCSCKNMLVASRGWHQLEGMSYRLHDKRLRSHCSACLYTCFAHSSGGEQTWH